ncbi:MAG TPA: hypothetical protein VF855_00765 [Acidimicrobiales bacterium]
MRLLAVGALTLVALPLVVAENRRGQDAGTRPSAAAVVGPAGDLARSAAVANTETTTTEAVGGYLAGPTTSPVPVVIDVAVPQPTTDQETRGRAAFKRWAPGSSWVTNPCATPLVKVGTVITVTNLDNGHSTTCVNVAKTEPPEGLVAVLDTGVFEQIGELVQSPVPVRLTW